MTIDILQFTAYESERFARQMAIAHRDGVFRAPGESDALMAARRAVERLQDIGWCT